MTHPTITLAPDMEARVRAVADRQGLAPEAVLGRLLESALAEEERQLQEIAAAIQTSMADFEAGRSVSLEDWRAESKAWIAAQ